MGSFGPKVKVDREKEEKECLSLLDEMISLLSNPDLILSELEDDRRLKINNLFKGNLKRLFQFYLNNKSHEDFRSKLILLQNLVYKDFVSTKEREFIGQFLLHGIPPISEVHILEIINKSKLEQENTAKTLLEIYDGLSLQQAVDAYKAAGFLSNQERLLWLLDFIEDAGLRVELIEVAENGNSEIKNLQLSKKETKVTQLRKEYGFSYRQALAFLNPATLAVLLEINPLMIEKGYLPLEVVALCTSKVTNLSDAETSDFIRKYFLLPAKLYDIRKDKIELLFKQGLFKSKREYDEEIMQAGLSYNRRVYA